MRKRCQKTAELLMALLSPVLASAASSVDLSAISLPPGFGIEVYTAQVPNARSLALGTDGTVFVATRRDGRVFAVTPGSATERRVITIASGLNMPNGVAFHARDLYVAELSRIIRFRNIEKRLANLPEPEVIDATLPGETHHGWRYIDFGPDNKLYISIGAPCNVCVRKGYGEIVRQHPDGGERETVAYGVRNSVGFDWHPQTAELWFTDNGRDMLGDDIPPGELNRVSKSGMHFGFPYCHGGSIADPQFGKGKDCADYVAPARKLGAHVAPLGMVFYDGDMFPEEYRGQIFIAEHGSWNRSRKIGYRVTLVRLDAGHAAGYEPFAEGWLQGQTANGRPVDLLVLHDGSILVSDDQAGQIYRIFYSGSAGGSSR